MGHTVLFDGESSNGDSATFKTNGTQKTFQCSGVFDDATCKVYWSSDGVNFSEVDDSLNFTASGTADTNLSPKAALLPAGECKATIASVTGNTSITLTVT